MAGDQFLRRGDWIEFQPLAQLQTGAHPMRGPTSQPVFMLISILGESADGIEFKPLPDRDPIECEVGLDPDKVPSHMQILPGENGLDTPGWPMDSFTTRAQLTSGSARFTEAGCQEDRTIPYLDLYTLTTTKTPVPFSVAYIAAKAAADLVLPVTEAVSEATAGAGARAGIRGWWVLRKARNQPVPA